MLGHPLGTLVGHVARVELLVDNKVEGLNGLGHLTVVVGHVVFLGLEHAGFDAFLREILDEGLVLRQRLVRAVQRKESFFLHLLALFLVAFVNKLLSSRNLLLRISQVLCGQLALNAHKALYQRLVFLEHLVVALRHRTRDDQRRTGIVNQH